MCVGTLYVVTCNTKLIDDDDKDFLKTLICFYLLHFFVYKYVGTLKALSNSTSLKSIKDLNPKLVMVYHVIIIVISA